MNTLSSIVNNLKDGEVARLNLDTKTGEILNASVVKNLKDGESKKLSLGPQREQKLGATFSFDENLSFDEAKAKNLNQLHQMIGFLKQTHNMNNKSALVQIYVNGIFYITQMLHRLENGHENLSENFAEIINFLEDHKKRTPVVMSANFHKNIENRIKEAKIVLEMNEKTEKFEEFSDILEKSKKFNAEEKIIVSTQAVQELMFQDTEKSPSLYNEMIALHQKYHNLDGIERVILNVLEFVNAEYIRIKMIKYFGEKQLKKVLGSKKKPENNMEENKFFQIAQNFEDSVENIDTETLIEEVKSEIEDILSADNITDITKMEPIMEYVEDDFAQIVKSISVRVAYIFQNGNKKERKSLATLIKKMDSKNIPEKELQEYLQFVSQQNKKSENEQIFSVHEKE